MFNMLSVLRQGGYSGSQIMVVNHKFQYTHAIYECAPHYLIVIQYMKNLGKCPDSYERIIPSLEKIIDDGGDKDDIIAVSRITDYKSLHEIIHYLFPQELLVVRDIISPMTSDELAEYISSVKKERNPNVTNEKYDVITSYLEYCLTEKQAYENHRKFVPTPEEIMASRDDMLANKRANDAARAYAYRRASRVII